MSGVSVLIVALVFVVLAVVVWAILTARRLDRLHIRLDRARAALDSAVEHRDAVADIVANTRDDEAARTALAVAEDRVELSLRLYNGAVAATRAVRLKPGVRALRLAGTAPMPEFHGREAGAPFKL
ncbi:hypothetical protein [Corynebacterium sp. Marseille-P3884]|uniref:hypothetical protein n=1 Tax=Corynebacterium sp. Marseille-P3884 TaxID=2495409 RepID=UPI001B33B155|nr:hypothetical protein [Corynebacterium sp. Marseille-P3884]MBP3948342.1 hypothetical protein [Corynebacterium sp. Marseille-P3884]